MKNEHIMLKLLYVLRTFLILNFVLFIFLFFNPQYWKYYLLVNSALIISYIVFIYLRLLFVNYRYSSNKSIIGYSVIVPVYNEDPILLKNCIKSIINQSDKYLKEILIINDGSTNNCISKIKQLTLK